MEIRINKYINLFIHLLQIYQNIYIKISIYAIKMIKLDLIDRKILYELDLNARIPATKLARKLRKSKETINFRLNRLIREKYINYFYTVLNTSKLGYFYYKVYLKLRNISPEKEEQMLTYLQKQKYISYLASTSGSHDCIFLIMVRSPAEMSVFMDKFLKLHGEDVREKEMVVFLSTHRFNQQFLLSGRENKDFVYGAELGDYKLDEIDQKILFHLKNKARATLMELSTEIGVDYKVIKYHLTKLEQQKIILGYVTSLNYQEIGLQFVQLNLSLKDPNFRREICKYFQYTKKSLFGIELLGKYDLTIELHLQNQEELKMLLDQFRTKFADKYLDYDILNVDKERLIVWSPFI